MQLLFIIGVAGGSSSGKTILCKRFISKSDLKIVLIQQDSYYKDLSHLASEKRKLQNFDHPDSFDNDLLYDHLVKLRKGISVKIPEYDYMTHTSTGNYTTVYPGHFILVEGIMLFVDRRLRDIFDYKIYIDVDSDVRLIRRMRRDIKERGRSMDSVIEQYLTTVKPMHSKFVEPSKKYADVLIKDGNKVNFFQCVKNYIYNNHKLYDRK